MERQSRTPRYIYLITVLFLVITGFSQMPISKRYYIADIPGLAWTAKFFITHYMHYLFSAFLIFLSSYFIADYFIITGKTARLTISGYIRSGILLGLIVTGVLLVIQNLSGTHFSPVFITILDLLHLGFCVTFLIVSLYTLLTKKRWLQYVDK